MPPRCRRQGNCSRAAVGGLRAFLAQPGVSGQALPAPADQVIAQLSEFDTVFSVTKNTAAVMACVGRYAPPQKAGEPLRAEAGRINLRIQTPLLGPVVAVDCMPAHRKPYSLHLFDCEGAMLHEAYLTSVTDDLAIASFKERWNGNDRHGVDERGVVPKLDPRPAGRGWIPDPLAPLEQDDSDGAFHFDSILGDGGLNRRASLPDWGGSRAWQVEIDALRNFVMLLCDVRMPLVIGVGNAGFIQLHEGAVDGARRFGNLMQVSSKNCNVSLSFDEIDEIWVTRTQTRGAWDYTLEIYDWRFNCVAQFQKPETGDENLARFWRQLVSTLPRRRTRQDDTIM